jgi:hypothetical protein
VFTIFVQFLTPPKKLAAVSPLSFFTAFGQRFGTKALKVYQGELCISLSVE